MSEPSFLFHNIMIKETDAEKIETIIQDRKEAHRSYRRWH